MPAPLELVFLRRNGIAITFQQINFRDHPKLARRRGDGANVKLHGLVNTFCGRRLTCCAIRALWFIFTLHEYFMGGLHRLHGALPQQVDLVWRQHPGSGRDTEPLIE